MAFTAAVTTALDTMPIQSIERWVITNPYGYTLSGTAIAPLLGWSYDAADDQLCATLNLNIDNSDAAYSDENEPSNIFMMGTAVDLEIGLRYASGAGTTDEYDYLFRGHIVQVEPVNNNGIPGMSCECDDPLSRFREGNCRIEEVATSTSLTGIALTNKGGGFYASPHTGWSEAPIPKVETRSGSAAWAEATTDLYELLYGRGQVYFYSPVDQVRADYGYYSTSLNVTDILHKALEYPLVYGGPAFSGAQLDLADTEVSLNLYTHTENDGTAFDALTKLYDDGLVPVNYRIHYDAASATVKGEYVTQKTVADYNVKLLETINTPRSLADVYGRVCTVGKVQKPQNLCQASGAGVTDLSAPWRHNQVSGYVTNVVDGNKDTQYVVMRDIWAGGAGPGAFIRSDFGEVKHVSRVYYQMGDDSFNRSYNVSASYITIYVSAEDTDDPQTWTVLSPKAYKQIIEPNKWLQVEEDDCVVKRFRHVKVYYDSVHMTDFGGGTTFQFMSGRELRCYESDEVTDSNGNYPSAAITASALPEDRYQPGFQTAESELAVAVSAGATTATLADASEFVTGDWVRFWNNDDKSPLKEYRKITVSGNDITMSGAGLTNDFAAAMPVAVCYDFYVPNLYTKIVSTYGMRTKIMKDDSRQTVNDCQKRSADYLWEYIRSFQAMTLKVSYDPRVRIFDTLYVTDTETLTARGMLVKRYSLSNDGGSISQQITGVDYCFDPTEW